MGDPDHLGFPGDVDNSLHYATENETVSLPQNQQVINPRDLYQNIDMSGMREVQQQL